MYCVIGKLTVFGLAWTAVGFALLVLYHQAWGSYNSCWLCGHGSVKDRVARWFARQFFRNNTGTASLAAPILVPMGLVMLGARISRERRQDRTAFART